MARAIPYKQAVQWLIDNDDCYWLKDDEPIMSVSASLVADIYTMPENKLISDLKKLWRKDNLI